MNGCWVEPDIRDEILSYVRAMEEKTEIRTTTLLDNIDFAEFLRMAGLQHTRRLFTTRRATVRSRGSVNHLTTSLLEREALLTLKMHEDKLLSTSITTTPNDFTAPYTISHLKIF